jgi:ADP-ribose pyrophosphatase
MTLVSSERVHTGRVVNLDLDTVRFPDGSTGRLEMFRHPGAAAVIPFVDEPTADDPRVIMIRQFRHATDGYIWEIPAGRLDRGEDPAVCARRELQEEAGVTATRLERIATIYTTPGFTDERIHLFYAHGLASGQHQREADEFMELHTKRWSELMEMVRTGEIDDGKTVIALLYVQSFVRR